MSNTTSASEQIELLQQKIEQLKHRSHLELKVKLAEARHAVVLLEKQIESITGKAASTGETRTRKPRSSVTIEDVVSAIKGGATNYKAVALKLGSTPVTVTKKIKEEGKAAGIVSKGQKASFKLLLK